ncbi:MAG TPA: OsmC family protein [Candidatus Accumulibacter phosphatis]|nr:MAG: OsmC-like protein [Candidatus Accumulibacter sp. SK-11]HAY26767.1 osmotically inducible protein OsmC [Accumulibacter sp.]HRL74558.1 OsmC family protein [Candidatus Accumulibacter phosphatis]HCN67968.1 osmotically inducible protein OsmC [Accumulibacter sp.]HCV13208.1 osmotically inducible protein OsmC [Accumulibacter sp.]
MAEDMQHDQVLVSENGRGPYQQTIRIGKHLLLADEPASLGGEDAGPAPFDLLLASLGACTSITLRMYAERKRMPLTRVSVELQHDRVAVAGGGTREHIVRRIRLEGDLSADQRGALLAIANKCPMYRTLHSELQIDSLVVA